MIDLSDRGAQPTGRLGARAGGPAPKTPDRTTTATCAASSRPRCSSDSDTEVVLKAYRLWGARCVDRFKGMFAFAIAERDSGRLRAAWATASASSRCTWPTARRGPDFASTLPALLRAGDVDTTIDRVALHHYLSWHSVVPAPRTILAGVRKLAPATVLTVEPDGRRCSTVYGHPPFARDPERADWAPADWQDATLEALRVAVDRRMVADVPAGVLLWAAWTRA